MDRYEYTTVRYHTCEWALLVEQGWFTRDVDQFNTAYMMRKV